MLNKTTSSSNHLNELRLHGQSCLGSARNHEFVLLHLLDWNFTVQWGSNADIL
jgi:hypothetical protein